MLQQSAAALQQQTRRGLRQRRTWVRRPCCQWRQQTTLPSGRMGRLMQTSPVHCWPAVRQRKTWGRRRPVQRSCRRPPPWRLLPWLPWLHMAGSVASVSCDGTNNIPPLQSESRTRQLGGKQAIPRPHTCGLVLLQKVQVPAAACGRCLLRLCAFAHNGQQGIRWSQGSIWSANMSPNKVYWVVGARRATTCCEQALLCPGQVLQHHLNTHPQTWQRQEPAPRCQTGQSRAAVT